MAKGLSLEEKRTKALEYFHDTKGVYLLKELEKVLPKLKGITAMTVKEVITSLVDDNLVTMEKIGTSNYFWSFPSHAQLMRQQKIDRLQMENDDLLTRVGTQESELEELQSSRQDPNRPQLIEQYELLKASLLEMEEQLAEYKDFNPEILQFKKDAIIVAKEAANRWTDNVFTMQGHLTRQHALTVAEFNQMFDITDKFDNIE